MTIYPNTKGNAKRIGWERIAPEYYTGDVTASHVIHDHRKGMFHFVGATTMTEEMKKYLAEIICTACDSVWDQIGHDCLAVGDGEMTAAEVVEMCVDADRMKTFDQPDGDAAWQLLAEDFKSYSKQLEFVASQMPFQLYGY